jgi:hypothetical protein
MQLTPAFVSRSARCCCGGTAASLQVLPMGGQYLDGASPIPPHRLPSRADGVRRCVFLLILGVVMMVAAASDRWSYCAQLILVLVGFHCRYMSRDVKR